MPIILLNHVTAGFSKTLLAKFSFVMLRIPRYKVFDDSISIFIRPVKVTKQRSLKIVFNIQSNLEDMLSQV